MEAINCKITAASKGPKHHWFGYYDKTPWSLDGRELLAMESDFADRQPKPGDSIRLGTINLESPDLPFTPFAETTAWCWQTGCMLQWLPGSKRKVIYNTRDGDRFASVVHDLDSGKKKTLPLPIFCVAPDGKTALSLNFARLAKYRPGYGYEGIPDPYANDLIPRNDGVWQMDLPSGQHKLVLPTAALSEIEHDAEMDGVAHRVNHIQIDPTGKRFGMLHRYMRKGGSGGFNCLTRFFTANLDGSDVYLVNPNRVSSHYDWRDANHILIWARVPGTTIETPTHCYILFTDRTKEFEPISNDIFPEGDGHCSYSPDRQWVVTDTYPDRNTLVQKLILYHPATKRRIDIGRFNHPPPYANEYRCDLHPRWSRDGRKVCVDSVDNGTRQMYVAERPWI